MREIKFRAWDIRNSKMVYDALQTSEIGQLVTVNANYFNSPFSFFDGCKWMQYTGLKDKNGKEIYEGDILEKHYGSEKPYVIVAWHNERAAFINNDGYNELLFQKSLGLCEIIGNIYENPELVNQKQESY